MQPEIVLARKLGIQVYDEIGIFRKTVSFTFTIDTSEMEKAIASAAQGMWKLNFAAKKLGETFRAGLIWVEPST